MSGSSEIKTKAKKLSAPKQPIKLPEIKTDAFHGNTKWCLLFTGGGGTTGGI